MVAFYLLERDFKPPRRCAVPRLKAYRVDTFVKSFLLHWSILFIEIHGRVELKLRRCFLL